MLEKIIDIKETFCDIRKKDPMVPPPHHTLSWTTLSISGDARVIHLVFSILFQWDD